jgi:hypothetical protein
MHLIARTVDAGLSQGMRHIFYLVVVVILACCGSNEDEQQIVVAKELEANLKANTLVYGDAQNDLFAGLKQRQQDHWASFVRSELSSNLRAYRIKPYGDENRADLRVEAIVRPGRGFPRFGRFFVLITEYINFINIRFIDAKSGKTIGEVEYNRARFADNPPYLVRTMIDRLVQSLDNPKGG